MKITKARLVQIIKEEIETLPDPEEEQDSVESMIYRFMKDGANISDDQYESFGWMHDSIDPDTATLEDDGEEIKSIINDAFETKEKDKDRNDKPGTLEYRASLEKKEDGTPYITFSTKGTINMPAMEYLVLDNPDGGITVQEKPERKNYNESVKPYQIREEKIKITKARLAQIIKEELTKAEKKKKKKLEKELKDLEHK